jgi:hypothetical protein
MLKGIQIRTGKVHFATEKPLHGRPHLVQLCGMNRSQHLTLDPVPADTAVTCGRCVSRPADPITPTAPTTPEENAMTTTVRKGTNRPAAAKRTRAAQRTTAAAPATLPEDFPGAKKIARLLDGAAEQGWTATSATELVGLLHVGQRVPVRVDRRRHTPRGAGLVRSRCEDPRPANGAATPRGRSPAGQSRPRGHPGRTAHGANLPRHGPPGPADTKRGRDHHEPSAPLAGFSRGRHPTGCGFDHAGRASDQLEHCGAGGARTHDRRIMRMPDRGA